MTAICGVSAILSIVVKKNVLMPVRRVSGARSDFPSVRLFPYTFQGGMYVLNLYNWQSGGVSLLFLALFEVVTVAWGYGADRFAKDIETMIGYKIWPWWPIAWKFCTPVVILGR